jgi:hypothetical protein
VKLATLESVEAEIIEKLDATGIRSSEDLLDRAATAELRGALAARTGIDSELLLRLARMSDRMRISGIAEPITQLFDALGIESAAALAQQDAAVLIKQMRRKNVDILVVRGMPPESTVARWIEDAKKLPPVLKD